MKLFKPTIAIALTLILWLGVYAQTLTPTASTLLGPQAPIGSTWFDQNEIERAKVHGSQCANAVLTDSQGLTDWQAVDRFIVLNYYGLPLTLYIAYQRSGDPELLNLARACADKWYQLPGWIESGAQRDFENGKGPTPRNAGVGGLILRALDGRPDMWDWILAYTRYQFDNWLKHRVNDPRLYYGVRDGAFMLHYAVWLAKALPDTFPLQSGGTETNGAGIRTQLLADVEAISVNYFGRLQYADGSWRWDDYDASGGPYIGIMQPFMVGLLLNALIDVHRFSLNETVKASVKNQILKACVHLYADGPYRTTEIPGLSGTRWRDFWYVYHGGTTVNPTQYEQGGSSYTDLSSNGDCGVNASCTIGIGRQSISTIFTAYAYAYLISGDPLFKTMGDELFDSAFVGSDGYRGMADSTAKNYNQAYRTGSHFLVWRGSAQPTSSPTASPSPSPSPTPSVTPTPEPIPEPVPTPAPCTLDVPASISVPPNGTGKIGVSLNSMTPQVDQFLIRAASSTPGQVSVFPDFLPVTGTSATIEFGVRVKKRSAIITFTSPCPTKKTVVMVQ